MQADRIVIAKTQEQRAGGSPDRDTPPSHDGRRTTVSGRRQPLNAQRRTGSLASGLGLGRTGQASRFDGPESGGQVSQAVSSIFAHQSPYVSRRWRLRRSSHHTRTRSLSLTRAPRGAARLSTTTGRPQGLPQQACSRTTSSSMCGAARPSRPFPSPIKDALQHTHGGAQNTIKKRCSAPRRENDLGASASPSAVGRW